jgi:hypothetical protein
VLLLLPASVHPSAPRSLSNLALESLYLPSVQRLPGALLVLATPRCQTYRPLLMMQAPPAPAQPGPAGPPAITQDMLDMLPPGAGILTYFSVAADEPQGPQPMEVAQEAGVPLQAAAEPAPAAPAEWPSAAAPAARASGGAKPAAKASVPAVVAAAAESNVELTNNGRRARRSAAMTSNYAELAQVRVCVRACVVARQGLC